MNDHWSLVLGHTPGPLGWTLIGVALLAVLYEAWTAIGERARLPGGTRIRAAIVVLRAASILALLGLVLELTVRVETLGEDTRRIVVLVDESASMDLADAPRDGVEPTRRLARAVQTWASSDPARTDWTARGLDIELQAFAGAVRRLDGIEIETLEAVDAIGPASELASALAALQTAEDPRPLGGVVVLSDGIVGHNDAARERLLEIGKQLGVPVTTVATGAPVIRDVAVANPRAGEFAFVENVMDIEADVLAHGLAGERAEVELRRDGELVDRQAITLSADGVPRPVRFEVVPEATGQFVYEIRVPPAADEATTDNNRRAFVVKVLRDKVRILHVAGRPDWDVRALRTLLRRDPNVELLSYYILRDAEDIERSDIEAELSLIAFPVDELFRDKLGSFDLLILHNFDARSHGSYLGNIAGYVREGGSLVVIGGDMGLASGDYAALSGLMPTEVRAPAPLDAKPFKPEVSEAGRRHPITSWIANADEGWGELPPLDTFNEGRPAPPHPDLETAVLLRHPELRGRDGEGRPLLSVAEIGGGRTMVLATGSSWRLGFAADLPLIDGARPYDLLWLGAIRWLLREGGEERLVLEPDRVRYRPDQPVELRIETLSATYAAEPGVDVSWQVRRLGTPAVVDGDAEPDPARGGSNSVEAGSVTSDGLGQATAKLDPLPTGDYEAIARRADDGDGGGAEARRVFRVDLESRELERVDASPGTELLAELAQATGGRALRAVDGDMLPPDLPLGRAAATHASRVESRRDVKLWSSGWTLLLLLLTLPGEWLLRRRYGRT